TEDAQVEPPEDTDAGTSACSAAAAPAVGRLGLRAVIAGGTLSTLTDAVQPPGSNDWYLVEQRGRIHVLREGATALEPTPFLNLSSEISLPNARTYDDRGLVSIAFPDDYATSGLFYVSVTPDLGAFKNVDLLLRFQRSA